MSEDVAASDAASEVDAAPDNAEPTKKQPRNTTIDQLRGLMFFPMLIYHCFAFYDMEHRTSFCRIPIVDFIGNVRILYMLMAGYSATAFALRSRRPLLDQILNRIRRSTSIIGCAMLITLVSHSTYPRMGIKFGILHFIAVGTILITPFAQNLPMMCCLFLLSVYCYKYSRYPTLGRLADTIVGGRTPGARTPGAQAPYSSMDWFPINKNIPYLCGGSVLAHLLERSANASAANCSANSLPPNKTSELRSESVSLLQSSLATIGRNSLTVYTVHMLLLFLVAKLSRCFSKK